MGVFVWLSAVALGDGGIFAHWCSRTWGWRVSLKRNTLVH